MNFSTLPHTLRLGGIALLALTPLSAQFSQLATTDDGKHLYFTSFLLLRAAPLPDWPFAETRIYRAGPDGVTLFAERGVLTAPNTITTEDGASLPQVTGDGSITGFTLNDICYPGSECMYGIPTEAQLRGKQNLDLGPGELQLSRNGRWALLTVGSSTPAPFGLSTLVDLQTGQRIAVPPPPPYVYYEPTYRTIASDGTLLVQLPGPDPFTRAPGLWKQGKFTAVDLTPQAISDDASTLVYAGSEYGPAGFPNGFIRSRLVATSVSTTNQVVLFQSQDRTQRPLFMGMSNDGRFVLYRVGVQYGLNGPAYIADTQTGKSTALTLPGGELATDGAITGAGDFVFLSTTAGRIIKWTVLNRTLNAVFPPVPHCDDPGHVAAGSLVRLHCTVQGTAAELQGVLRLNDFPMPVLFVTNDEIGVQVPWGGHGFFGDTLTINTANDSPFQPAQTIDVLDMIPWFEAADPNSGALLGLKLIKGDWSGILTEQPKPGDIIYAYMTGLGGVDGPMETGVAASLTVPEPILGRLTCRFSGSGPAETVFAGLAPGMIGIYQVAFRIPLDAGPVPIQGVACSWVSASGSGSFGGPLGTTPHPVVGAQYYFASAPKPSHKGTR